MLGIDKLKEKLSQNNSDSINNSHKGLKLVIRRLLKTILLLVFLFMIIVINVTLNIIFDNIKYEQTRILGHSPVDKEEVTLTFNDLRIENNYIVGLTSVFIPSLLLGIFWRLLLREEVTYLYYIFSAIIIYNTLFFISTEQSHIKFFTCTIYNIIGLLTIGLGKYIVKFKNQPRKMS